MSEVDPRAVPGTFEKTEEGASVRTAEPTLPADSAAGGPDLALADLQAIAEASQASGFPVPPQVAAAIEAAQAAQAEASADARRQARAKPAASPPTSPPTTDTKPAASAVEAPKE